MEDFLNEVVRAFQEPLDISNLSVISEKLQIQFKEALAKRQYAMQPSYLYKLPTGDECGTYLVIDVGGSILRLAMVELKGRDSAEQQPMNIVKTDTCEMDDAVRALKSTAFFDWIASKIDDFLPNMQKSSLQMSSAVPVGLSWSYPVEHTSLRNGKFLGMSKGFNTSQDLIGQDLRDLMMDACHRRKLNISLDVIVNDSAATFLSAAYLDGSARFALVLGTGVNAALMLPLTVISPEKLGSRPESWYQKAHDVLLSTELSVFGGGIWPMTIWDKDLDRSHINPGLQPLEYLIGGRYLGEIVRLVLADTVRVASLFGSNLPELLAAPYSLETKTIAVIESDDTPNLQRTRDILESMDSSRQISPATYNDLQVVQRICQAVSHRAGAYLATALHALWMLHNEVRGISPAADNISIGCHGSVIQKYPGLRSSCQTYLDQLTTLSGGRPGTMTLISATDATIFGAAVAVACAKANES